MRTTIDTNRIAMLMTEFASSGRRKHGIAVVLPLQHGMKEVAAEYLAEGPPFDLEALGLARHQVFLTDSEVIFVFETKQGLATLDEMLAQPDFWTVASAWEHVIAGQPRFGSVIFEWPEHHVQPQQEHA
jgi:hypothetical protein